MLRLTSKLTSVSESGMGSFCPLASCLVATTSKPSTQITTKHFDSERQLQYLDALIVRYGLTVGGAQPATESRGTT